MLLRQVQARPLQGHHLRALRRRGDAAEGPPRAHGPHRPRRAGLAHLVLQGRSEPHRLPARHRSARAREGPLLRGVDRHGGRGREARQPTSPTSRTRSSAESERIYVDRDEALQALEVRLQRRRDYFLKGAEQGFDEDDDFWTRGLNNWAEEQGLPTLEDARTLVSGIFKELAKKITTEDSKKIRELVRDAAIRPDRKLSPRELEQVASAAEQILQAIRPLERQLDKATGLEEGRDHEAHPSRGRRADRRRRAERGGRRARDGRRRRRTSRRRASSATACSRTSSTRGRTARTSAS